MASAPTLIGSKDVINTVKPIPENIGNNTGGYRFEATWMIDI
jgi:hypothetical protein